MKLRTVFYFSILLLTTFLVISAQEGTVSPEATVEAEVTAESTLIAFLEDSPTQVNIELVFDASGSMAAALPDGELRIDAARRAVRYIIATLPEDNANIQVGFRVFGHEGDNTEANRALSCQSTSLVVPLAGVDKPALSEAVATYRPVGWTPITLALTEAALDFPIPDETDELAIRNVIIIVTDGEETCDADPCAAALAFAQSDAEVVAHVVGFGLDAGVAETLRCIADNSGGLYFDAAEGDSLAGTLLSLIGAETARSGFDFYTALPTAQFPELRDLPFQPIPFPDYPDLVFPLPSFPPIEGEIPTPQPMNFPTIGAPSISFPEVGGTDATPTSP